MRHRLRVRALNRRPGIRVAPSGFLGRAVLFQTASDGQALGGTIVLADWVTISDGVVIAPYGGSIEIAAGAYVGPYCVLYGHGGLVIGRNSLIAAHTVIVPMNHGFARSDVPINQQPLSREGITIGEDVWIGAGCKILDGVRIGRGSVIGAGSVVTKDVGDHCIAFGVPATVVGSRTGGVADRKRRGG
jgi:acetyltransferase-like isoleucine patch superfamily enzyme